jgi:Putative mono-oxygenase ydhR
MEPPQPSPTNGPPMHAQLITYTPTGISPADYNAEFIEPLTRHFEQLDSLVTKVWVGTDTDGQHGGFYVWRDKDAMDAFMASDLVGDIASRPYIADLTSVDWPVNAQPSIRTRGLAVTSA